MGSLSIQKGKRAERTVAGILNPVIIERCVAVGIEPFKLLRNLKQTQSGGFDLDGLDWLAIEVKHHKTPAIKSWWDQTCEQAQRANEENRDLILDADGNYIAAPGTHAMVREPVLIYKIHGGKWQVMLFVRCEIEPGRRLKIAGTISMDDFLIWFEKRLDVELKRRADLGLF